MRTVLVLVATAGCNSVFGIETTGVVDGPPAADAAPPPVCPTDGSPPVFRNELYQVPAKLCVSYSVSEQMQTAAAICPASTGSAPGSGVMDGELTAITFSTPMPIAATNVRLAPEGDRLLVSGNDSSGYTRIEEYALNGTTWDHKDEVMLTAALYYPSYISTPSAGTNRRMVVVYYDPSYTEKAVELGHDSTGWSPVSNIDYTALGISSMTEPTLSADGLRLVFVQSLTTTTGCGPLQQFAPATCTGTTTTETDVYISTRSSVDAPFGMAHKIASVPSEVSWPYMTPDCGRIYFSALNTVFYLKQ